MDTNFTPDGNIMKTQPSVPGTASSTGVAGTIAFDVNYLYVCIAENTWRRVPFETF